MSLKLLSSDTNLIIDLKNNFSVLGQQFKNDTKNILEEYNIKTLKINNKKLEKENLKIKNEIDFFKHKENKSKINVEKIKKLILSFQRQRKLKVQQEKIKIERKNKLTDFIQEKNKLILAFRENTKISKKKIIENKNKKNKKINEEIKKVKQFAIEKKNEILRKKIEKTKSVKNYQELSKAIIKVKENVQSFKLMERIKRNFDMDESNINKQIRINRSLKMMKKDILEKYNETKKKENLICEKFREIIKN